MEHTTSYTQGLVEKVLLEKTLESLPLEPVKPVVLVGGCLGDIVATLDHLPIKGGDVSANIVDEQVGGCALNVARVLNSFKVPIVNAMPVGVGKWADIIRAELSELNLPVNIEIPDRDNGYCLAFVTPDKERTFITFEGAETVFNLDDLNKIEVSDNSIVYLNGYELALNNDLIEWVRGINNTQFVVDFGPMIYDIDQEIISLLASKNNVVFTLNEDEAKFLFTDLSDDTLRKYSVDFGVDLVVRLGSRGALTVSAGKVVFVPAFEVDVVDTIGAGDCHTGALVAALSSGLNLDSACLLGNVSGSYTVGQLGAKNVCPPNKYLEKLSELCE